MIIMYIIKTPELQSQIDKIGLDIIKRRIRDAMDEYMTEGILTCICGNCIEPDGECYCGEPNPLILAGMI